MVKRRDTPQARPSSGSAQQAAPQYQSDLPYPGYSGTPVYSGHVPQPSASGRAVASMILSIVSIFTCWFLLSIPGLILGKMEMNAIRDGQAPKAGETFAKIGFYVGIVVTILTLIVFFFWIVLLATGL
jgi:Domain of unknown function (DUF4190)